MKFFSTSRLNTNKVLPIILGLILPLFHFYSDGVRLTGEVPFILIWAVSFIFLNLLWHFLWQLWKIKIDNRRIGYALCLFVVIILLWSINQGFRIINIYDMNNATLFSIIRIGITSILFLSIQYALKSQQNITNLLLEKEQLQTENYKTQLQSLRSKVDPHFLFNTLNTLRIMVRNRHENAEKFVLSLSDFYRQTLQYNENSTIALAKEIEVLKAYLFLMQSRNQAALIVDINIKASLEAHLIPTLALQIVTENCFKHNKMTTAQPLHISIKSSNHNYIVIRNNIQPKLTSKKSSGHGLENIRQRYKLLDIENGVDIKQASDFFEVKLKLIESK